MGFDFDPADQANISAADFAQMCDEMAALRLTRCVLLEALERLSFAAACRDNTMGDQCRLIEVKAELVAANQQAQSAIASAKGGAQ